MFLTKRTAYVMSKKYFSCLFLVKTKPKPEMSPYLPMKTTPYCNLTQQRVISPPEGACVPLFGPAPHLETHRFRSRPPTQHSVRYNTFGHDVGELSIKQFHSTPVQQIT